MRTRLTTRTWLVLAPTMSLVVVACGSGRNYDNPPEIAPITAGSSTTTTTATTTTVFVPTTAPTTLGPVTAPPTAPPPPPPPPTPPPTAPPPPTTPPPTTGETYTVVDGDTLFGISRRLGVTLDALLAANNMNTNSLITAGQRLQIPVGGSAPATNAPATNPPATNAPATNPPATNAPATNPPATNAPGTNPPGTSPPTSPQNQPTTTLTAPPGAVRPTGASATCQAPDSAEANGTPIVFSPSNVFDLNPATAWRCAAPATGQSLTVTLGADTHLTSVGMIGGYDKKDPLTGIDRWPQNHRARQVRWTFSDGTSVTQDLTDSRAMQSIPVDVTTSSVTIEIVSTFPPSGPDPRQMVVVAEVQLISG